MLDIINFRELLVQLKDPSVFVGCMLFFLLFIYSLKNNLLKLPWILPFYITTQIILIALYAILTNNYDLRSVKSLTELIVLENEFVGGYFKEGKIISIFSLEYLQNKHVYTSDISAIRKNDFKYASPIIFKQTKLEIGTLAQKQATWLINQRGYIQYFGYGFAIPFSKYEHEKEVYLLQYGNLQFFTLKNDYQGLQDVK